MATEICPNCDTPLPTTERFCPECRQVRIPDRISLQRELALREIETIVRRLGERLDELQAYTFPPVDELEQRTSSTPADDAGSPDSTTRGETEPEDPDR